MPDGTPPIYQVQQGHFPNWPNSVTLNHLATQWLAPHGTITARSGWQDHGRTQYALVQNADPQHPSTSIYVISAAHSKGVLQWAVQHENDNPQRADCPIKLIRKAGPTPPGHWKANVWRNRAAAATAHRKALRRLLRDLNRNTGPHHDPRVVLKSGRIVQHTPATYRRRRTDAYWDPQSQTVVKLNHEDIDLEATFVLRQNTNS